MDRSFRSHLASHLSIITLMAGASAFVSQEAVASSVIYNWGSATIGLEHECTEAQPPDCSSMPPGAVFGTFNRPGYEGQYCVDSRSGGSLCYTTDTVNQKLNVTAPSASHIITSKQTFPANGYISFETTAKLNCTSVTAPVCFVELAAYNGERNYRALMLSYKDNQIEEGKAEVSILAPGPCEGEPLICGVDIPLMAAGSPTDRITVNQGETVKLRIDYFGHTSGGSGPRVVYYVNDVAQLIGTAEFEGIDFGCQTAVTECGHEESDNMYMPSATTMTHAPHVALLQGGGDGTANGTYGPLKIYTGLTADQSQTSQTSTFALTATDRVGQFILMASAPSNITVARLHLKDNCSYRVEAYDNNGGVPGNLVAVVSYQSDRDGMQDVPLWVPDYRFGVWVVVSLINGTGCTVGTTTTGTEPYHPGSATYITSSNSGASWISQNKNMTFATFIRQ